MRHTVIIPSYNTLEHLKNTYSSLLKYAKDVDIIIIDDASSDGTAEWLGTLVNKDLTFHIARERRGHTHWYDEGMKMANTPIVSILHSDMIIGPGYFENMLKHLKPLSIVCATRIEPPIHPAGKEKIVRDFGMEAEDFKWDLFEKFVEDHSNKQIGITTKGIFAPWMLYKEDHLSIGGHDQRFAPYGYEDSDIFNRWIQAGYQMIQSRDALCYHMTCRGHKWNAGVGIENSDYKDTMERCRKEYIRKWGDWIQNDEYQYPTINPKFDRGIILHNGNDQLLEALEPWCDTLYSDLDYKEYIDKEQKVSIMDMKRKLLPLDNEKQNAIFITIDGKTFNQQDFTYLMQLAAILKQSEQTRGTFTLGNLKIEIIKYYEEILN
tara:strand:+ start:12493 stop:13626 length:1134 start_codon:yes stop_codon:yes gene_type:complete